MNKHYTLSVELTLIGPILTAGGEMSDPGIDAPLARDRFGRFMLPFSLIKGKVLDAVSDFRQGAFHHDSDVKRFFPDDRKLIDWLGLPSKGDQESGKSLDPDRGLLHFSDFHTDEDGNPDNVIDRIQIDPESGSVKGQMLQMVQAPFGYGQEVKFNGTIEFITGETEAAEIETLMRQALRWVPSYGAYRTVGFGRTKTAEVTLAETTHRSSGTPVHADTVPVRLKLDRPLCIVGPKHSTNHFDSLEVISGTILKGVVARMIQEFTGCKARDIGGKDHAEFAKLREHFSAIRFGEARPMQVVASGMKQPIEPPLSIAMCPKEEFGNEYFDAALEPHPRLLHDAAPAFMPDWKGKNFATVRGSFGWSLLPRERRTRTAVNPTTGRAADEQLFSYGLVLPDRGKKNIIDEEYVWETTIGVENIPVSDQQTSRDDLSQLLKCGLTGIGKTRAAAEVKWLTQATAKAAVTASRGDKYAIVTLQTDCLMTDPETLKPGTASDLKKAYEEFWANASGGAVRLERFFARQSLHGGFVSRRANSQKYEPFLLTDHGSVFVLTISDQTKAALLLKQWQQHGLPNAAWLAKRYATDSKPLWQGCPYIRENGYGEIMVDLACHGTHRFKPETSSASTTTLGGSAQ